MWMIAILVAAFVTFPRAIRAQGNPIGPEFRVNTYTTSLQHLGDTASDASGSFVVVWSSQGQDGLFSFGVFGQRFASTGAPLGPEFRVNTYTTGDQDDPAVASDSSGNFVIVWSSRYQDGMSFGVFGQRYASLGAPLGPEFRVNTYTTADQVRPSVALDSSGDFVVVWDSFTQDGFGGGVFGQRYASSGTALGPEFRVNSYTMDSQVTPSVSADASGNFVVAWASGNFFQQDGHRWGVFAQRYDSSGAPLGPEFRVNTYTTSYQDNPSITSDASGNFVIVWTSLGQDGYSRGVFGQRYDSSGVPLGPEVRVNTTWDGSQQSTGVASDSSGNFVVVWNNSLPAAAYPDVVGQRFASTGGPLGTEFRVNTYTTGTQGGAAVGADSAGNFVVVWTGNYGANSPGVFGQRYSQIVPVELMRFRVE